MIFAAALGAAWWRALPPAAPAFVVPAVHRATAPAMPLHDAPLATQSGLATLPSLAESADGRLLAVWRENTADSDANIHLADWNGQQWSPARLIVDRRLIARGSHSRVSTLGRPIIAPQGTTLHLWVGHQSLGPGAHLSHLSSSDGGLHWSAPQRLTTSPWFNRGAEASSPPLPLADGGLALPLSHALFARQGEWLRFDAKGRIVDKARLAQPDASLAPQVAALDQNKALALLHAAGTTSAPLRSASSTDSGQRWQAGSALAATGPSAAHALIRLANGWLLLASSAPSATLGLWLSANQGENWHLARTLPLAAPADLALLQTRDGTIHLALGNQPGGLRHLRFNSAWLQEGRP